jgi:hypothetical protein
MPACCKSSIRLGEAEASTSFGEAFIAVPSAKKAAFRAYLKR